MKTLLKTICITLTVLFPVISFAQYDGQQCTIVINNVGDMPAATPLEVGEEQIWVDANGGTGNRGDDGHTLLQSTLLVNGQLIVVCKNVLDGSDTTWKAAKFRFNIRALDQQFYYTTWSDPVTIGQTSGVNWRAGNYTNICLEVKNPYQIGTSVRAYWKKDGVQVKQKILRPGESAIECFDVLVGGNWALESGYDFKTSEPDYNNPDQLWGQDGNGGTTITNGAGGGSFVTNTWQNLPPWMNGSNAASSVVWSQNGADLSGGATEGTLRDVGGVLHADNEKTLEALHLVSDSINGSTNLIGQLNNQIHVGLQIITNQLGQIVFNSSYWTNDNLVVSGITNLNIQGSNFFQPSSNVWVMNWPTNDENISGIVSNWLASQSNAFSLPTNFWAQFTNGFTNVFALSATNQFDLTNYATETTLQGISNLLGATVTNFDWEYDPGQSAMGSNALAALADGVPTTPANQADVSVGVPIDDMWVIQVPYYGIGSIDLNPFHVGWVVSLASFIRNLVKWTAIAGLLISNITMLTEAIERVGAGSQTKLPKAVQGVSKLAATFINVIFGVLGSVALAAIPMVGLNLLVVYLADFRANPIGTPSGFLGVSVWIVDQFFPLAVLVATVFAAYLFRVTLSVTVWGVHTAKKFIGE